MSSRRGEGAGFSRAGCFVVGRGEVIIHDGSCESCRDEAGAMGHRTDVLA